MTGSLSQHSRRERIATFLCGTAFLIALIVLAIFFPEPTPFQYVVFRVVLALAAAGFAAFIPGFIQVEVNPAIRAGGALAVFVVVYFFSPATMVSKRPEERRTESNSAAVLSAHESTPAATSGNGSQSQSKPNAIPKSGTQTPHKTPPQLRRTRKESPTNQAAKTSETNESHDIAAGTENCAVSNDTTSNNIFRNGAVPDLSSNCNSRFDNNLVLGGERPKKLTIGGEENEITHNTFPEMDVQTTDQSKRNKLRENLFQNPVTLGQVPTAINGVGADKAKILAAQTENVYKCTSPCGAYGPYPDDPIDGMPSDLPLAKALHGSSRVLADQLSDLIDKGNAIVLAFFESDDVEALDKNQRGWQAKVETAVSNLDPRLVDALTNVKSTQLDRVRNHNQTGVNLCKSIKGKLDLLTIYQNQLRGVRD